MLMAAPEVQGIDLFKGTQDTHFLQKHKKFIQQPCIAEFMHFLDGFSCIQSLRHLCIISPRHLPVESFLDHAGSFCLFVLAFFALHAARSSSLFAFPSAYHFPILPTTLIPQRQWIKNKVLTHLPAILTQFLAWIRRETSI